MRFHDFTFEMCAARPERVQQARSVCSTVFTLLGSVCSLQIAVRACEARSEGVQRGRSVCSEVEKNFERPKVLIFFTEIIKVSTKLDVR